MTPFFLLVEISIFIYAAYLLVYKQELAIIHMPAVFFSQAIITPKLPALVYYVMISLFILFFISKNLPFFKTNIFALLLCLLFLLLIPGAHDLVFLRPFLFAVFWLFLLIPLIGSIYPKYPGRVVFKELSTVAFIVLCLFCLNVIFSSLNGYAPNAMYNITTGVLYGNLYATDFNIIPIALFIVLMKFMAKRDWVYFAVFMLSLAFIMLSLRRSVMGLSLLGIAVAVFIFLTPQNVKSLAGFSIFFILLGSLIVINTNFLDLFQERYALRDLDNRELSEEKRLLEYELIYKDMFVYQDYSPWIGYGLFNSGGNYGKGELGTRTLHADLTNMAHSTGLIGLTLYLLVMMTAFYQVYQRSHTRTDKFILLFCALVFIVYTITGRFTNISSFVLMILLLKLPLTIKLRRRRKKVRVLLPEKEMEPIISPQY